MKHTPLYRKYKYKHLYLIVGCWLLSFSSTFAQLSGTVFKDFNNDGFQTPPHELGMRNITVSVYGVTSQAVIKLTDINGNYSFSAQEVPVGSKVRVEFTGLGANNDGKKAGNSNTNVQFLTVPAGGASNINLGILTNTDYCQIDGTLIYTPCYVNGNALGGGSAGEDDALVSFPYYATGVGGTTGPMPHHIAKASEVGSLWGMDYQARGKTVLTSAITRRHVSLGPLGTGGIYKFDAVTNALGQLIDVKTIGIDTGPDPHTDLPADKLLTSQDAASVDAAGKVGIGGIALSGDEKTLYMVNLYDRKLYSFFVGVPAKTPSSASVKSYAIPNPCGNGDYRPWGVKEYQGNFYLGVVCTNETSQDSTTLSATIYKFNPKTGAFTVFYQFPLTYKRGEADATDACQNIRYWRPWSNTFPVACSSVFSAEYGKFIGSAINPQPLVSDIEFDTDGSMIIGLMDRFGLVTGFKAMAPVDDGKLYDGFVSGDILRVYNNNGVYEMESNGQAGPLTGSGVNNDEGFGGGEFYGRDYWEFFGNPAHSEITNGGLMLMPGTGEVLASAMDPVDEVYHAGGFHIYSNTDGSLLRSFAVYAGKKGTLGKSGGVGDMKASCGVSFIEIGNRIWIDTNKNGIQDPDENGVGGVTVTLHDMEKGGQQVGSTVSSPNGEYIFDNSNVLDTVKYEHKYQIRIDMSQSGVKTKDLIDVAIGGNPILPDEQENPDEMRDSDAKWVQTLPNQPAIKGRAADVAGYAIIDFQTGATTLSNHSLDIGLIGCTPPTNVIATSNSPVVEGNTINFTATSTGGTAYAWTGPNGFTSTTQNPSISSATMTASGTYTVTVLSSGTCTATATTAVIVTPTCTPPTLVAASSNSPVSQGATINFTASSTGGTAYAWTGPNGFTSTIQNPSISSATLAGNGTYTVTVLSSGTCTATATTTVIVTPTCTPPTLVSASSNSPVGQGGTINFTATSTGGTAYAWTGPNGFTSTIQNPSIPSATLAASGTYNLIVLSSGTCLVTVTTIVIVTPTCTPPTLVTASSNSPVNQGTPINFIASSTGGTTYAWTGPNGFTSTLQNPSIISASASNAGIYTLTVLSSGTCTATATTSIILSAATCTPPTLVIASNNSPVNQGNTINFTASSTSGVAYSWKGPNGFTSTVQNPSITSATLAASGIYTLTVTGNGTCTATATTNVTFYASMGDYAWYDLNKNGIQDNILSPFGANLGKELPAQGIVMELHKADGTLVGKDTTDANGRYSFNQLIPGFYYVKFDPASYPSVEYAVTGQNSGLNDSLDNDIERVVYKSANFSLASGQNDPTWDIGFFRSSKSTIGDPCTCHDIVYDPDETYEVLDEVIVESTPGGIWIVIEQTGMQKIDSLDNYDIPIGTQLIPDSKKPGKFSLRFAHDVGVGYTVKVTNGVDTLTQSNLCNIPALFTNVPKDTICAFENPIKLSGKMLLNNVDVTNGVIKFYIVKGFENYGTTGNPIYTQITDFNPRDFAPGDTIDIIAEYKPNITTQCPIKKWYRIVLSTKPNCLAQIGDYVWEDVNKNGIQNVGENGIPNVSVTLLDGNGVVVTKDADGNSLIGKTTNVNGFYEFIKLPPGDYMVKFGKPASYTATSKDAVSATDTNDSDADPTTGISQKITLTKGERNATIDAGFYLTCVPPTLVSASSNTPVEDGGTINLKAIATGASSYEWTGPNGFTSNLQNPSISAATYTRTGTYNVRAKASENCSTMASTFVLVTPPCTIACIPIKVKKIR